MSGSNSFVTKLVSNVFPRMPDFYALINEQCDITCKAMSTFAEFMKNGDMEIGNQVRAMEKEADAYKAKEMEILGQAFATPMDREDIYRAVTSIDEIVNYAKTTVREMEALGIKPDDYMAQMAQLISDGTEALRAGWRKLSTHPADADVDAQAARKAERNVEKLYRQALAELFRADAHIEALTNKTANAEANAMAYVIDIFKRREMYRHLSNAADRLESSAEVLHDILVQVA